MRQLNQDYSPVHCLSGRCVRRTACVSHQSQYRRSPEELLTRSQRDATHRPALAGYLLNDYGQFYHQIALINLLNHAKNTKYVVISKNK